MSGRVKANGDFALGKGQVFDGAHRVREELAGNFTRINPINEKVFSERYKLAEAYRKVRNLEFRQEGPLRLQRFDDYLKLQKDWLSMRLVFQTKPRPKYPSDEGYRNTKHWHLYPRGRMLVLVDNTIYNAVKASVDQYVLDVGRQGYWATIHTVQGATPAAVRNYIRRRNPVGVLMVGAIPAAWYEIDGSADFPCDLFYMDTSGSWHDNSGDKGRFDGHSGDVNPELWVGRLYTPTAGGSDAALINEYFARNHKYRLGRLGHARSAMAFVDDDWQHFDDCAMDEMFPSSVITKYTDPNQTDADLYKAEVNAMRSWVQLCAHSSPHSHALYVPAQNGNEYINTAYFRDLNPPNAHFYNLFCCGPGLFTANDYLAGWYIFDQQPDATNFGLTAVASAKSGSMLYFEDFYEPLGDGKLIGDAYVDWWRALGNVHSHADQYWFYGLTLLGDPTLSWWVGAVPDVELPEEEDVFDHYPRKMQMRWDPVNLPGVEYSVEVDAFGAVVGGQWAEESGQTFRMYHNITANTLDHNFVGMQRGRWRVRAVIDGQQCAWSPWSYFRFTI